MTEDQAVSALTALAHSSRLRIFRHLVVAGQSGDTPTNLIQALDLMPTSLSFHLKELVNAGLVTQQRSGRNLIYRAAIDGTNALISFLTHHCCQGVGCSEMGAMQCAASTNSIHTKGSEMSSKVYNVLFICTGNSARSIMAEVIMNAMGQGRFKAYSAGSHPRGEVHPMTLEVLTEQGYDLSGLRSKSWTEFTQPDAPQMDFIFTVCDQVAGESCPAWPGQPVTAHWGFADPTTVEGGREKQLKAFAVTHFQISSRIRLVLNLPFDSIDHMSLQNKLREMGQA